jgi:RNA recognition motif-containing protein
LSLRRSFVSKLFVGNLSYQLTEEEFKNTFQPYGNIKSLRLLTNKGFGFVEYETSEEAQKAIENLNGKELKGRPMRVELAKPREEGLRSSSNNKFTPSRRVYWAWWFASSFKHLISIRTYEFCRGG